MKNRFAFLLAAPILMSACAASVLKAQDATAPKAPASTRAAQNAPVNLWIEAEAATRHNFSPGFSQMSGAGESGTSGGLYLSLRRDDAPDLKERLPFYVEYEITAPRAGNYVLWLAASPQDQSWASPLWLRVDQKPFVSLQGLKSSGAAWGDATTGRNYFSWIRAADLDLKSGKHTLRLEVRNPRTSGDKLWATFLDALLLTSDANYVPKGVHPSVSPQPTYEDEVAKSSPEAYRAALEEKLYRRGLAMTQENISPRNSARVLAALRRRPLPTARLRPPSPQIFGVHAMFPPFVVAGQNSAKIARAYELLARAGNDSFRTVSSMWHNLGENFGDFSQLDFQMKMAEKYGMAQGLGIGYPPPQFTKVGDTVLSAARPEYQGKYRDYLRALFAHVKNRRVDYLELGNEVDAPATWWRASTAQDYVNELRWLREERDRAGLKNPIAAFAATYARNDSLGGADGGRRFVTEALKLGADKYADEYSLHYTWPLAERDFSAFFRRAVKAASGAEKPLINTEEASYGAPPDVVKCFARDFFLYDMRRVDYYLARDWFENEVLISSGLFDRDWNPKLRLLPFALSVDAMKDRQLVGMAIPAPGIEAYVLKKIGARGAKPKSGANSFDYRDSEYSLVLWKNASPPREQLSPEPQRNAPLAPSRVGGVKAARAAFSWDLSARKFDAKTPIQVGEAPLVIFADAPPNWKTMTRAQFLSRVGATKSGQALLPQ